MNTVITRIIAALLPALLLTYFGVQFVPYLVPLSTGLFIGALLFHLQSRTLRKRVLTLTSQHVKMQARCKRYINACGRYG